MEHRSYQGQSDLHLMLDLLTEGRKANNGTYYVHRGDLQWWLFYNDDVTQQWKSRVRLWMEGDRLIGWGLLSPFDGHAFDVYADPLLRGTGHEQEMLSWAVEQMSAYEYVQTVWVADDDEFRIRWLEENGFSPREEFMHLFKRSISEPLSAPSLPEGFHACASRGVEDVQLRAAASHASFGSTKPIDEYQARLLRVMQSPVYIKEHDVLVTAPDGQVSAFCCIWTDPLNKMGYFEPVGVHPDFHRRGLGKSLLLEGLCCLQSEGMTEASVCTNSDNPAAIRLYESAGFLKVKRLLTYRKGKTS
jgi:mycothiol synthase